MKFFYSSLFMFFMSFMVEHFLARKTRFELRRYDYKKMSATPTNAMTVPMLLRRVTRSW
jgi:hypothetical protein